MWIEENVSRSFIRDDEFLSACGTAGFYYLWSRNRDGEDLSKPHLGAVVCDASRSTSDTLTSEVETAITVLKFRFRRGEYVNFHTIPVSLLSSPVARHRPALIAARPSSTAFTMMNLLASPRRTGMAMVSCFASPGCWIYAETNPHAMRTCL